MTLKTRSGFFGQSRRQKAPHTWTSPWWGGHLYFQDGPLNWHYHTLEEKICWLQVNLHKQEWKGGVPATIQALDKGLPWEGDSYLQKSTTPHQVEVSNKQISPEINCIAVPVLNSRRSTLLCTVINYMWDGLGCKKKVIGKRGHSFTHRPLSPLNVCVSWQDVLSKMAQGLSRKKGKMMLNNQCPLWL